MIENRLEKLRFIAEEMQIAFHLASKAPDAFASRTLARHILIRAKSFIEHARAFRKPLKSAGFDTREFHAAKEAYASNFSEYFQMSRDRLSAHVQDFDFGKRIELWNNIEIVKISFFVDGAVEIYKNLAKLNLPSYVAYSDPPELTDPALNRLLLRYQRSKINQNWVEFGVDPLALTRDNTTATLNTSPVHSRAGQLALIRGWVNSQFLLLNEWSAHHRVVRILKCRIITDIVSFCDCLVTRTVTLGAPQEMDGFDKLISAEGQSASAISDFVTASNFHGILATIRRVRDQIGAHLEIEDAQYLSELLAELDKFDIEQGLAFFEVAECAFVKVCFSILYLKLYAVNGHRVYGVATSNAGVRVPFSENSGDAQTVPNLERPINDEESYGKNLSTWLDGDESQKGNARQFFWDAFMAAEIVEEIEEIEKSDNFSRHTVHHFRKVHSFLRSTLENGLSESDFNGVLDLIISCRSGDPYPLTEILVRYGRAAIESRQRLICHALGELGSSPHSSATEFLRLHARSSNLDLQLDATVALFKTYLKSEGIYRINHRDKKVIDFDEVVDALTSCLSKDQEIICMLSFASVLSGPTNGTFFQPFAESYTKIQQKIAAICIPLLNDDVGESKSKTLNQLIQTNDYVGICVLLAIDLEKGARSNLRQSLLFGCCNGLINTAAHDQAVRHLAMCFLLIKEFDRALKIAQDIAARNPDWISAQILVVQILVDIPSSEEKLKQDIARIRWIYKLEVDAEAVLADIEKRVRERRLG